MYVFHGVTGEIDLKSTSLEMSCSNFSGCKVVTHNWGRLFVGFTEVDIFFVKTATTTFSGMNLLYALDLPHTQQ